jgi:hypothetical protein
VCVCVCVCGDYCMAFFYDTKSIKYNLTLAVWQASGVPAQ